MLSFVNCSKHVFFLARSHSNCCSNSNIARALARRPRTYPLQTTNRESQCIAVCSTRLRSTWSTAVHQSKTLSVVKPSLLQVRRSGTRYRTVSATRHSPATVSDDRWRRISISSLPLSTHNAVEMLHDSALYKSIIDIDIKSLNGVSFSDLTIITLGPTLNNFTVMECIEWWHCRWPRVTFEWHWMHYKRFQGRNFEKYCILYRYHVYNDRTSYVKYYFYNRIRPKWLFKVILGHLT